jgi:hypothetical protein
MEPPPEKDDEILAGPVSYRRGGEESQLMDALANGRARVLARLSIPSTARRKRRRRLKMPPKTTLSLASHKRTPDKEDTHLDLVFQLEPGALGLVQVSLEALFGRGLLTQLFLKGIDFGVKFPLFLFQKRIPRSLKKYINVALYLQPAVP